MPDGRRGQGLVRGRRRLPDEDNDKDGLLDTADTCPNNPEDMDGYKDDDGCPEVDADGDGIKDEDDKCPMEAEVFNGTDDEDGCPDDGRTLAFVEGDAVVITDKIFFDLNRARIKTRSQPVLNAVASILKAHSDLKVRVEGHTDDQGQMDWNRTLSQLRSEKVRVPDQEGRRGRPPRGSGLRLRPAAGAGHHRGGA